MHPTRTLRPRKLPSDRILTIHAAETCADREPLDLKRRVENFLAGRNLPGLRHLDVEVTGGVVTLKGRVRSFYEKQLANHCCRRVAGVHEVVDGIDVVTDGLAYRTRAYQG